MICLHRLLVFACWSAILLAYALAILPQSNAPRLFASDKVEHMLAFFVIALLARLAYPRTSLLLTIAGCALLGALIELTQMIPALHRDASFADWLADIAAILFGVAVAPAVAMLFDRFDGPGSPPVNP
jgi:VanZ family protein